MKALNSKKCFFCLREDTHKKKWFFSGRTTKQKNIFFSINPAFLAQKLEKKKSKSKSVSGYYQTKQKNKKKSDMDH